MAVITDLAVELLDAYPLRAAVRFLEASGVI
jgi:hypothetical protein